MEINGVTIEDTYAEAFNVWAARIIITAATKDWAFWAATEATGFASSTIRCPCEAGIESYLSPSETPDHRPGYAILICSKRSMIKEQVLSRVSDCIMPVPTTAAFNGHIEREKHEGETISLPVKLHYFGDKFEKKVTVGGTECWSIPLMGGNFVVEEEVTAIKAIAGGNFFILGDSQMSALSAAAVAADAIKDVRGAITPFPGGVVSSGSKVGSKFYKFVTASTNEKYCPTIREAVIAKGLKTNVPDGVKAVYEIVINGVNEDAVKAAMKAGIHTAATIPGIVKISAGNYGGNLGPYKFYLKDCI
ncbi:MAG TPA: formylmethanofuran--tetrahydromethanopterin N-formyltransferase [Methanocorpusculum sp.]|nr:formylmethanofuran--tetrahydromethanopterin N-formyltransferase [Methanocorpusculum sp.]